MADLVVLNYNDAETTIRFLKKTEGYQNIRHICVVDNDSTDQSYQELKAMEDPRVTVLETGRNGGYGAGNNFGIRWLDRMYHSEFILISNPDVLVEDDVVGRLEAFLSGHQDYAIAAPFMCNAEGKRLSGSAFRLPTKWQYIRSLGMLSTKFDRPNHYDMQELSTKKVKTVGAVSGCLFMVRADAMMKYGMFDEKIFLYCEEVTLGMKMHQAGQKMALLPQEKALHLHSVSISKSYKSDVAKRKLLNQSKLYVIRTYFHANGFEMAVAHLIADISIAEAAMNGMRKRRK